MIGLADARPELRFLAVPTWGTTGADRAELSRRPNIELAAPADDIADLLRGTRVVLMPSLWDETFGYTAVEAMLHGVPVLASDVGGLAEAKLGVPYLLPVEPIRRYLPQRDGEPYPAPVTPPQDLSPWLGALDRLVTDPEHYREVAEHGRRAATEFVSGLDAAALEGYLATLPDAADGAEEKPADDPDATDAAAAGARHGSRIAHLDPRHRAALATLLARRGHPQ